MLTPYNNMPITPDSGPIKEDDDKVQRIPDRPVDQLDDEKKKNKFKDALSKKYGEKKSTEIAGEAAPVVVSGAHDTISPFDLARGAGAPKGGKAKDQEGVIAVVDMRGAQATPYETPRAPVVSAPATPGAPPVESPPTTTAAPVTPEVTPKVESQKSPHPAAPAPAYPLKQETTPATAHPGEVAQVMSGINVADPRLAAGVGEVAVDESAFPVVQIGSTLPKVDEVVQKLNPTDPNVLLALQTALPIKTTVEMTIQPLDLPHVQRPTQAARVAAVDLADQMIRKLTTVTTGDRVETKIELRYPPLFEGVTVNITEFKTSTKEFNVSFSNLTNPDARALVESRANQQHLKTELLSKGYILHTIIIEPKIEGLAAAGGDETMGRERSRGERDAADFGRPAGHEDAGVE